MDIGSLVTVSDHEAGAEYNVRSPVDGKLTDVFITIKGADSLEWRKQKRGQTNKIIESRSSSKKAQELDYDSMDVDALVAVTVAWRGIIKDGEEWPCTAENVRFLYEGSPRIVSQLLTFISDSANFTKG
jgi:hypothetical protein